jgi:hypothetical protein
MSSSAFFVESVVSHLAVELRVNIFVFAKLGAASRLMRQDDVSIHQRARTAFQLQNQPATSRERVFVSVELQCSYVSACDIVSRMTKLSVIMRSAPTFFILT